MLGFMLWYYMVLEYGMGRVRAVVSGVSSVRTALFSVTLPFNLAVSSVGVELTLISVVVCLTIKLHENIIDIYYGRLQNTIFPKPNSPKACE